MKKKAKLILGLVGLITYFVIIFYISYSNDHLQQLKVETEDYWIATHYFANLWPKNMWDSEFSSVNEDFARMKEDGFNCVVILIPWREFQPDLEDPLAFNETALSKLQLLLSAADEEELGIILRLGYVWDYYENRNMEELEERYWQLIGNEEVQDAWLGYSKKVYKTASAHESFLGGFICWEDFWNAVSIVKETAGRNALSYEYADFLGYNNFIKSTYNLKNINFLFDEEFGEEDDIYLPSANTKAFRTFYEYYDLFLNNLLKETQEVFPGLSMEVRVDDDLIIGEDGKEEYYSHSITYLCEGADYSTIVYGIPMGFKNVGEQVIWEEALQMTGSVLNKVGQDTEFKKIFIDQFLFYDNTQKFSYNAQIVKDQIDEYLLNCPDTLLNYSMGYGIWTYKDYYFDAVANGEFAKGLESWKSNGKDVSIKEIDGLKKCFLSAGSKIEQLVEGKIETVSEEITCSMDVELIDGKASITICLDDTEKQFIVKKSGKYEIQIKEDAWGTFSISSDNDIYVDNIKLYNFCQKGLLYDTEWKEEQFIDVIREMNSIIAHKIVERKENQSMLNMIDEFSEAEIIGKKETEDYPWGKNVAIINGTNNEKQLFLTPGVSLGYDVQMDTLERKLHLEYSLHEEAVAWNISDGAEICVTILNENGEVLEEKDNIRVGKDGQVGEVDIDLSNYMEMSLKVILKCYEKKENSENGDWIVINKAFVQ